MGHIVGLLLVLAEGLKSKDILGSLEILIQVLGRWRVVGLSPFGWITVSHELGRRPRSLTDLTRMPIKIDAYLISINIYVLSRIKVVANACLRELLGH